MGTHGCPRPQPHLAAGAVESLATLRQQLWARIAEHASTWADPPVAVVVYGSAARGDGDIASDIDLLAVMATNGERPLTEIRRDGRAVVGLLATVPRPVEVA